MVRSTVGSFDEGSITSRVGAVRLVDGDIDSQFKYFVPRSFDTRPRSSSGRSSMNDGAHIARDERVILQQRLQEGDVGGDAADAEFRQGATRSGDGGGEVATTAGQLRQHGVEVRADLCPLVHGSAVENGCRRPPGER